MTQIDPKKVFIGTKYAPKLQENGTPELNADGSQVGGTFTINLYEIKDSRFVDSWSKEFTTNKYLAFLEDFNGLIIDEVVTKYFTAASETKTEVKEEVKPVEKPVEKAEPKDIVADEKLDLTLKAK